MKIGHKKLRELYSAFFKSLDHAEVPPSPLVPKDDPTTLFTGSGMQQFVPNLLGVPHPLGVRLFDIQPCVRVQDIEEVGDNRHDTFFEMMGNWSLGDYFKKEQLRNFFTFLTDEKIGLGIDPNRLYVTVFEGNDQAPRDDESIEVWKALFDEVGIKAEVGDRIRMYPASKNWWSRAGEPEKMPAGEPGGPDSEVFYKFDGEHDSAFGDECHQNCDCGLFLEIGNSVFMMYKKVSNGTFEELPKTNVDFGGGLERLLAAAQNDPDIFNTDVFSTIVKAVEKATNHSYDVDENKPALRIITDHIKTAVFMIKHGVTPSNKEQGYVLRRLLRRALVKMSALNEQYSIDSLEPIIYEVLQTYDDIYLDAKKDLKTILPVVMDEVAKFQRTLERGLKELDKLTSVDAKQAFNLYQSYGFPFEITQELLEEKGIHLSQEDYDKEFATHKEKSRSSADLKFKGGLADKSEQTVKYHTATHLIHQALFDVMDDSIRQEGSNITADRLRFDFYSARKPSEEEMKKVETIVNTRVNDALPVAFKIMPKEEAQKLGARSFFKEKYPDQVKVYFIGANENSIKDAYSKEFCGGPHVTNTSDIGTIEIERFKKIGSNMYRIYAK
ncbi:MAG: alanine--tRNA ligase [bacterium]|nr:alanine--tRNA ligase [bacterium]